MGDSSGIVVAGFGEAEHFPSVIGVEIWGIQNDQLRFAERDRGSVTLEIPSRLMAFAQKEMVVTFMEGVDPEYSKFFSSALEKLLIKHYPEEIVGLLGASGVQADTLRQQLSQLGEGTRDELLKELAAYRRKQHIGPIVDAVEHLPKEDLAALAESLVNLTSLKRRFTLDAETVGGPIDVAVISKGDGFVWMKRKHYFQPELNPQFFMRYLAGGKSDDQFEQAGRGPRRERA